MRSTRHKRDGFWSGRKDLNLRPLRPERSALPGALRPDKATHKNDRLSYKMG